MNTKPINTKMFRELVIADRFKYVGNDVSVLMKHERGRMTELTLLELSSDDIYTVRLPSRNWVAVQPKPDYMFHPQNQ